MAKYGWDPHVGRMLSTFFDPNFFGMFLVMLFSLLLAALLTQWDEQGRWWWVLLLVATLGAIAATFSRSTYLALLISAFSIILVRSWRAVFILIIILSIIGAAVPRVRMRVAGALTLDVTAVQRIQSWRDTFVIISDHPLVGVGYNAFGPAQLRYGFVKNLQQRSSRGGDSSFLLVLATTGIIGFTLFLLFYISLWVQALLVERWADSRFYQGIGLAMIGIIPAYIVHSQFVNGLFYPLLFIPFAFLAAFQTSGTRHLRLKRTSATG